MAVCLPTAIVAAASCKRDRQLACIACLLVKARHAQRHIKTLPPLPAAAAPGNTVVWTHCFRNLIPFHTPPHPASTTIPAFASSRCWASMLLQAPSKTSAVLLLIPQLLHAVLRCSAANAITVGSCCEACLTRCRHVLPARSLHTAVLPCAAEMLAQHAATWPAPLLSCLVVADCNIRSTNSRNSTGTAGEKLRQ
jgi:hypothetical protein